MHLEGTRVHVVDLDTSVNGAFGRTRSGYLETRESRRTSTHPIQKITYTNGLLGLDLLLRQHYHCYIHMRVMYNKKIL